MTNEILIFVSGLAGIGLHITFAVMNKSSGRPNTYAAYFQAFRADTIYAVLSFLVLYASIQSGEMFTLLASLPMLDLEIEPFKLGYLSNAMLGYCANSAMPFIVNKVESFLSRKTGVNPEQSTNKEA